MKKNLQDYLHIQKPVSTNLIPFYNTSSLDRGLSKELNNLLSDREITFGMLPEMEKKKKEYLEIIQRIGDIDNFDFQLPLYESYEVFDPPAQTSQWQLTPFNSVIQGIEIDYDKEGKYKNLGTSLLGKEPVGESPKAIVANLKVASKGEVGLVFNFNSYDDFWVLSYANDQKDKKIKNTLVIRRVLYGFVTEYGRGIPITEDLTNKIVNLHIETADTNLRAVLKDEAGVAIDKILIRNIKLINNSRCGLYSQNNGDAEFYKLKVSYPANKKPLFYSFDTELLKFLEEKYERDFSIYNVDLRPMSWLATFKRLWAEKFFTKNRLDRAETIYSRLLSETEEDAEILGVSPEDIDNAEGRVRKAFEEYLIAEDKFQEFSAFMSEAGVEIPDEKDGDDFNTLFSNGGGEDQISKIKQVVSAATYTTWKEFFYTCAILKKDSDVSNLITPAKRNEITSKGGDVAWNLYVKNTLEPLTLKTTAVKVPHYKFVISNIGDTVKTEEGECFIVNKYWKTNQTRNPFYKDESKKEPFKIEISDVNEVSKTIKEIMGTDEETVETDIREYKEIDGALVDQYGVTLQDHVIKLTESQDESVSNVLIVPVFESTNSIRPDQVMVIKDPIFSGKQLHPISVSFGEKYTMDVRWDGIGLGEFSHSVNLFPGEERELKVVSSKKKSWETVSKSKTSTKASSASETTDSSKRNDSFSSKISDSLDSSNSFSKSNSSKSKAAVSVKASGGFGPFSASASASYSKDTSAESSSKVSAVSKKASELASQSGSEVSNNNKVSFSSTTDTESSLESKVAGEDMETETSVIKLYNINEGKTTNFNFYQVTNIYNTAVAIQDVNIVIDTGIEIIPGTGLTISKEFELEKFKDIYTEFFVYTEEERKNLFKLVASQIVLRYLKLDRDRIDDDPQVLRTERRKQTQDRLANLRSDVKKALDGSLKTLILTTKKPSTSLIDQLPDSLLDLMRYEYELVPFEVDSTNYYTINTGKYYVDAHLGNMPATEDYLEERRAIETDKQKALVNELKKRTEKGVFFQDIPDGVKTLSFDGEIIGTDDVSSNGKVVSKR